jgi:hypothetical protein
MTADVVKCGETKVATAAFAKKKDKMTKEEKELLPFLGSPLTQFYHYALYQVASAQIALAGDAANINRINQAKREYNQTALVNPEKRTEALLAPIRTARPHIFFGQEVSPSNRDALVRSGYLPLNGQNILDGTNVYFLQARYERFETLKLNYEKWEVGTATSAVAFPRDSKESPINACSGHASTSRMEDAPKQLEAFMAANRECASKYGRSVPMIILMDANATSPEHYKLLKAKADELGLVETDPKHIDTTDKKRAISVQGAKVCKRDATQKSFCFVTKDLLCTNFAVGLPGEEQGKALDTLPNVKTPTDHRLLQAVLRLRDKNQS